MVAFYGSIFAYFATFSRIKFGFPCVVSALLIGSRCCVLHVMLLLLNKVDMAFLIMFLVSCLFYNRCFFRMLSVTTFSIIGCCSFLKLSITHIKGTNFKLLFASVALSSYFWILSSLKNWGSIGQFSVLKRKIVAPWDLFAYKWAIPYESETWSCWNLV